MWTRTTTNCARQSGTRGEHLLAAWQRARRRPYKVYVHHYANHGAPDPTPYTLRITIGGRTREFQGSLRHGEQSQRMSVDPRAVDDWYPLPAKRMGWAFVVMGAWGAALGLVLALGLRLPQAFFRRHEAYDPREFGVGRIVGGALGGGRCWAGWRGALGQALFGWFYGLGEDFARLVGLVLLGGLLGYGLAHCIPNLPVNPARWAGGQSAARWGCGHTAGHCRHHSGRHRTLACRRAAWDLPSG
jgi:hypothetical protein